MTDKEKIRAEIERRKDSLGFVESDLRKQLKFDVYKGLLSFIDSMEEEPKTDWLQELKERLDSLSKEDFEKVIAKYSRYGEEGSVDYDKLNTMLDESLSKETKESWNKRLGEEPVSEDLESEIQRYNDSLNLDAEENYEWDDIASNVILAARHFAKWQKEKMMANAVDGAFIRRNRYTKKNVLNGLDITCDVTQGFKDKDKIKVLFVKED